MAFILGSDGRDEDVTGAFQRYREYLEREKNGFPLNAFGLATSEWYFDASDHRCPHDAWVEKVTLVEEPIEDDPRERRVSLTVKLLGAYHEGIIELHYPTVFAYSMIASVGSHSDWRYDELRVSDDGKLVHEIEWCGMEQTGRWLIEASDLQLNWIPNK